MIIEKNDLIIEPRRGEMIIENMEIKNPINPEGVK